MTILVVNNTSEKDFLHTLIGSSLDKNNPTIFHNIFTKPQYHGDNFSFNELEYRKLMWHYVYDGIISCDNDPLPSQK